MRVAVAAAASAGEPRNRRANVKVVVTMRREGSLRAWEGLPENVKGLERKEGDWEGLNPGATGVGAEVEISGPRTGAEWKSGAGSGVGSVDSRGDWKRSREDISKLVCEVVVFFCC